MENGCLDPRKRMLSKTPSKQIQGEAFLKQMWTCENAENEGFRKHWHHELDNQSPTKNENVLYLVWTVENASVDANICICFRWIKNGGIRKRISVHVA